MHTGEPEGTGTNISREQILSALESLNDGFRGNAPFNSSGVDMEINFCLAARDPSGNPTSGINRVDASSITNYSTNGIESSNEIVPIIDGRGREVFSQNPPIILTPETSISPI